MNGPSASRPSTSRGAQSEHHPSIIEVATGCLPTIRPMVDTAVVLLRKNPTLGRHVFVSFDRSWLYVKNLDHSSKMYHELEGKGRKLFGWDCDSAVSSEVRLPTILLTLAMRLCLATELMRTYRESKDLGNEYRCQLFCDQHLDLLDEVWQMHMDLGSEAWRSKADALCDNRMMGVGGVAHAFMPSHLRAPCSRHLPDVISFIRVCNIRCDTSPDIRGIVSAVCHILSKATNHNCLPRNTADIMRKYACEFPVIGTFIEEMIQVSLLGNYPTARRRPKLWTRVAIRRAFRREYCPSRVFDWISRHDKLSRYCTREFYMYCIGFLPLVEDTLMSSWCDWTNARHMVLEAMDLMRENLSILEEEDGMLHGGRCRCPERFRFDLDQDCSKIDAQTRTALVQKLHAHNIHEGTTCAQKPNNNTGCLADNATGREILATVYFDMERALLMGERLIEQNHQISLAYNHKLHKGHWCSVFLTHLSEAGLVRWIHSESSPLNYMHYIRHNTTEDATRTCELLEAASEAERKLPGMGIVGDFRVTRLWLGILGIRSSVLDKLQALHRSYVKNETSDNSLSNIMAEALQVDRERMIFFAYLFRVHGDICNDSYELPDGIREAQVRALRYRRRVESWQASPSDLGLCAVCERCEEWRSPVAGVPMFRNPERKGKRDSTVSNARKPIYANGICHTMLDLATWRIHCKKKKPSLSSKRRKIKTRYAKNGITLTENHASRILEIEEGYVWDGGADRASRTCCDYPITFVHMLGRVKCLKGCSYLLCAYCGVLTYAHAKCAYARSLPTCGMHCDDDMDTLLSQLNSKNRSKRFPALEVVSVDCSQEQPVSGVCPSIRHLPLIDQIEESRACADAAVGKGNSSMQRDKDRRADSREISRYPAMAMKCVYCSCRVRVADATMVRIVDTAEVNFECNIYPAVLCRKCSCASFPYRKHQPSQFLRKKTLIQTIMNTNAKHPVRKAPWMKKRMPE